MPTSLSAIGSWLGEQSEYTACNGLRPFYLLARPGFWGGFGSFLDIFSPLTWNYVSTFDSLNEVNAASIYIDWCMVGNDLQEAIIEAKPLAA